MNIYAIILLISFLGLYAFFVQIGKLSPFSSPLLTICTIILFVYFFGLIGLLEIGLFLVLGIGTICFFYALITKPKVFFHWSTAIMFFGCGLLFLRYHDAFLLQYDDFSHWGLIAKHMLLNHAFPDQNATLIEFQSYPPGAACWIFSVCYLIGQSDGFMIFAQACFVLIAMMPLFSIAKNSFVRTGGIAALIIIVLSIYQGTASLMVDNLLAAVSIGAIAMTVSMRKSPKRNSLFLAVALTVLCLIKDSGIYFALLVISIQFYMLRRSRQSSLSILPPLLLPLITRAAWFIHIKTVFTDAGTTRHALTLQNMQVVSADRTLDQLFEIVKAVFQNAVSFHNQSLLMLALMAIGCLYVAFMRWNKTKRFVFANEWKLLAFSFMAYGLYITFLIGMYFFTMPIHAATEAVAFERYNITFALFAYGLLASYLLSNKAAALSFQRAFPFVLALILAIPIVLPSYRSGIRRLLSETYEVPIREQIYLLEQTRPLQANESASLYLGDEYAQEDFVNYIASYTFQQSIAIYTANTIDDFQPTDILYALTIDDKTESIADNYSIEIITLE